MIINISDYKDTKFLSYYNTLSAICGSKKLETLNVRLFLNL